MRVTTNAGEDDREAEVTELDARYILKLVRNDIKYMRSRSATRPGNGRDANASKIMHAERLAKKVQGLLREEGARK